MEQRCVILKSVPSVDALIDTDFLKSTLHRVTLPPIQVDGPISGKLMTKSRYSIPYFVSPDPKSVIECLPVCTDAEHPPKYEPVVQEDYRRMRARGQYAEPVGISISTSGD